MTLRTESCWLRASDGALVHFDVRDGGAVTSGVIVTVHGLGEHLAKYDEWTRAVLSAGWHAAALDLRGHGRTPGRRGDFEFASLVADLERFVEVVVERYPDAPVLLVAHSLGALVTLSYAMDGPHDAVRGAVVSNPPLGLVDPPSSWFRSLVRVLDKVAPRLPLPRRSDPARLTRDPERRRALAEDPLRHERITPRALAGIGRAIERVRDGAPEVELPLLVLLAEQDRVVDVSAVAAWAGRAGSDDVTVMRIAGGFHELLNDLGRQATFEKILRWCDDRA